MYSRRVLISLLCASLGAASTPVFAADDNAAQSAPVKPSAGNQPAAASPAEGFLSFIPQDAQLLGDIGGVRPWLDRYGMSLGLTETSEILGNTSCGVRQSFEYDGLTTLTLQLDTKKAFGLEGGLFNVSGLDIHGTNLSAKNLNNLQTASGIEADNTARLWELWYQQSFRNGAFDVKIGQQSLDQEFMVSTNALLFVNTMFGWPMIPSADLPSGGPAYPLSSPGIRLRGQASDSITLLGGIFNDNPSGVSPLSGLDSQRLNDHGTNFRLSDDPLVIAEIQYSLPGVGDMHYAGQADTLPGTYRLGMWYDFGQFADQKNDNTGLSLADPGSTGVARLHRGNYSVYVVADQMVWRPDAESTKGLSLFMRAMGAPEDRNLIDFSLNLGATYKGLVPDRDDDTLGLGFGYTNVSSSASSFDRSNASFTATPYPVRTSEKFIEVTYQCQLLPWIQLQPDFQYVFNTGAGVPDPRDATNATRIGDEAIFGIRTNITF